jgi:hypothetical protein
LRGGHAAHEAERHEVSLLEVEVAAVEPTLPRGVRTVKPPPHLAALESVAAGKTPGA